MHPKLETILSLLRGLRAMLGERYEVILHDLSKLESSIVGIEGNVTGRGVGGPATNFLLHQLKEHGDGAPDCINYQNTLPDGRVLRSTTIFIRDDEGAIIGSLCVNQDMTDFIVANKLLHELVAFESEGEAAPRETFAQEIGEVMEAMISDEIERMDKPVAYMNKDDKLHLVARLEDKGIFTVKNAVEYVAERLGVSNFTIYNYLKESRVKRNGGGRQEGQTEILSQKL